MWIKTRRAIPNVGGAGAVRNIDANSARCLIKMRWAEPAENPAKKPPPKPKPAPKPEVEAEKPKRTYQRRDAVPKQKVVLEAEELAEAKAEPEPKEGERDD